MTMPAAHTPRWKRLNAADRRFLRFAGIATAVVVAVTATGLYVATHPAGTRITAAFKETVGVYPGSAVRVLGVKVGAIDSVRPAGTRVIVTMTVDNGISIPAGADAMVVAPSLIADRYIQLSPPYVGGPKLADGAMIPASRTATPVEIDQTYAAIGNLAYQLGPNGLNKHGALSDVLNVGAANLSGNGMALGTMIDRFGQALRTLSGSQSDFFGTIGNLQRFTAMLKSNDGGVRLAEQQLAQVAGFLAADRQNLAGALHELAIALGQVRQFIVTNRAALKSNIRRLMALTQLLVNQRASLAQALDETPLAADNLLGSYDPATGTFNSRGNLLEITSGRCSYITNPLQRGCRLGSAPPLPALSTGAGQ